MFPNPWLRCDRAASRKGRYERGYSRDGRRPWGAAPLTAVRNTQPLSSPRPSQAARPQPPYTALVLQGHNGSSSWVQAIKSRPWWRLTTDPEAVHGGCHFMWTQQKFDWEAYYSRPPGAGRLLVNRFKGNGGITVKDRLASNMRRYARAARLDASEAPLLPLTFVITVGGGGPSSTGGASAQDAVSNGLVAGHELSSLRAAVADAKQRGETLWIVKCPPLNRGRGIRIFSSLRAIEDHLRQRRPGSQWVVQKYIEGPLLLDGRKFDIRLLVLVTPDHKVYMYRDSYVRTASGKYDPSDASLEDKSIHLVNDAVQIQFESYGM